MQLRSEVAVDGGAGEGTRGECAARLRQVVHGGTWPDHELARAVVRRTVEGGAEGPAADAWRQLDALVADLGPVERLAGDVERLAALHEWAVVADAEGTLCRLAEAHAGGFAGIVADAGAAGRDDPRPLLRELEPERAGAARICRAAAAAAALRVAAATALRCREQPEEVVPGGGRLPRIALRVRQRPLLGALADAYAITSLANAAKRAWEDERGGDRARRLRHRVAAAQALATETARDGVTACRERCEPVGGVVSDRLQALAGFLDRAAAEEGGALAPLSVVASGQLTGDGYEALAPVPRPVGALDLRDPAWWTWVARTAERHSHARAVVRMRDALRQRGDDAAVWNEVLPDALDVARRHAVRLTIEALVDDADRLADGSEEQMALLRLGALWYCREVDRDAAYLAGHAIVGAETLALLPDLADHLADLALPSLPILLDAFALDDTLLRLQAPPPSCSPVPAAASAAASASVPPRASAARPAVSAPAA